MLILDVLCFLLLQSSQSFLGLFWTDAASTPAIDRPRRNPSRWYDTLWIRCLDLRIHGCCLSSLCAYARAVLAAATRLGRRGVLLRAMAKQIDETGRAMARGAQCM